ncbi:MFS transporter [Cytobacillus praedii]|uniref:MFS transporter n=1 Tax=Cytobacillus praedii TaxID=1742358 RepID=A0A4V2NTT2_9BACI|nr:MFS transporter [Cytobacillus praedii]TCJ01523.1 MFS transporter [Cytobacillus praedii]
MNRLLNRNPYFVYIHTCFFSQLFFTFIFTVNLLYHVQVVNLNPIELVLVGTVLELTVFIFEIPTGVVSDIKSRKLSIIIGYLLIGIGFLVEGLFPIFLAVIVSQILWGIGYTFTSGSLQAWISDEIGEEQAASAFVNGAKASNLGQMIAIPLSIVTGIFMLNLPIILGGLCMIALAVYLMIYMKEEKFIPLRLQTQSSVWMNMKTNISKIANYSKEIRLIRLLFLIALFFGFYSEGFDRLWLTHFIDASPLTYFSERNIVIVTGAIQFLIVLLSFVLLHVINRSSIHQHLKLIYLSLFIGSFLIICSLIGFSYSTSIIGLISFYVIIQLARQIMHPLEEIWLNTVIPESSVRATFFSVKGQVDAIGQISGGPIIGGIASLFSIKTAIVISAILLSPVLYLLKKVLKMSRG